MKILAHLSKQQRYAADIQIFSAIILIVILAVMFFSFAMQQLYTAERNAGRDIRSTGGNFQEELFKARTHVTLMYMTGNGMEAATAKELSTVHLEESILRKDHTFLQGHSVLPQALRLFQSQEQTYTIILVYLSVFEEPQNIPSETEARLFITYTSTYISMLDAFQLQYTTLFVQNNGAVSVYSIVELLFEIILFAVFFFAVLRPAVKKFIAVSQKSETMQKQLIETHIHVRRIQHEQAHSVTLARDVVCVDHHIYEVAHQGSTMTVFYNEKADLFLCECKMYVQDRFCFHTNRARWLHDKIFRRTSVR